ncbi:MAG: NAD-dependent dihydropyrimidine dehydrogenase subunit PreA [Candidatus Methanofastidiosia archaeon]
MLEVEFLGLKYKNPCLLASAPPTMDGDHIARGIDAGWGGAVTKTLGLDKDVFPDVRPRLAINKRGKRLIGMENIELITTKYLDWWVGELKKAKDAGAPLIVSIMAAYNAEDWQEIARWAERSGADAVELNLSCPHGTTEKGRGMVLGQNPEMVEGVCKWVKEVIEIPVIAKLTPNITDIVPAAQAAESGGADAISAINTVLGLIGVDIYKAEPTPAVFGITTYGGNCGPAMRPIGLRIVSQIAKAVDIPISGIGGIDSWENVVEYIMVGATTTQVCTAVMWSGFDIISKWLPKIEAFMKEQGYDSIEDMIGVANKNVRTFEELKVDESIVAEVDMDICNMCGKCEVSCRDAASGSLTEQEGEMINDYEECIGCGLCMVVCPVDAIQMRSIK